AHHRAGARHRPHAARARRAGGAGRRAGPVGRPGQRPAGDRQALRAARRPRALHRAQGPARRPRDARGARRRGSRRRRAGGGGGGGDAGRQGGRGARGPDAAERGVRLPRGAADHPVRRRWCRRSGLRGVAHADVHAVGGAQQVPGRGLRHLLRRGGGHQVRHLRGPRALCLRHPLGRGRHPPARADQPVRQPGPAPDVVRRGRGRAGARADRQHRDPGGGGAGRRLPVQRPRGPVGQHHRLRRTSHPRPDRHRRLLPEREEPAAEQGVGDGDPQGEALGEEARGGEGAPRRAARRRRRLVGRPDALLRPPPVPDGQGPAHRVRDRQPHRGLRRRHRRVPRGGDPLAHGRGQRRRRRL
ncbi:MAG: Peptide chain release factor 2, partial [uncultured Nocardioidaceae bacterium]